MVQMVSFRSSFLPIRVQLRGKYDWLLRTSVRGSLIWRPAEETENGRYKFFSRCSASWDERDTMWSESGGTVTRAERGRVIKTACAYMCAERIAVRTARRHKEPNWTLCFFPPYFFGFPQSTSMLRNFLHELGMKIG